MERKDVVLAGMAPAACGYHSPVQIQKLLFLLDRNIPEELGGAVFDFQPYDYGPFDRAVYEVLEELYEEGLVEISRARRWKQYRLTDQGQADALQILGGMSDVAAQYVRNVSDFVRNLTFTQLVRSVYKAYPEMRANSVFQE